ncbi:MAG: hypothetical protein IJA47_03440 [Oscillospiraceae bacterium]|nr:hypothetical protein [Oscillospiraceae bacterium]
MGGTGAIGGVGRTPLIRAGAGETDNVDTCLANSWYWIKENAQGCPVSGAPLFVVGANGRIWQYVFDSQSGSELRRDTVDGGATWNPWEWENPPVADGTEYRTTKRYGGKPVYAKNISVENAPDSAEQAIPHGLGDIVPVKWEGVVTDGENVLALPFLNKFTVGVDRTNITLSTTEDYSGYAVEITVWYCKED